MLKKLRKVQINTKNYVAHRLNLRSPWEDIYLTDSHVSMFLFLLEIFELIVTDEIVDHIVTYSNLYANQSIGNKEFKKTSRLCKWEDITAPAIRLYLAALIYLGILYKPKKHFYYTKKNLFETPEFRSQNKMVLLEKFLHVVNNEELGDSYNKAAKIQPILEKLVERFKLLCQLERDISIDKSLLLRKVCLNWKQYIPK